MQMLKEKYETLERLQKRNNNVILFGDIVMMNCISKVTMLYYLHTY